MEDIPAPEKAEYVWSMNEYDQDMLGGPWTPSEERLLCRGASVLLLSMLFTIACMLVFLNIGRVNMQYVLAITRNETDTKDLASNVAHAEGNIFATATSWAPFHVTWSWGSRERRAEQDVVTGEGDLRDQEERLDVSPNNGDKDDGQDAYVDLPEW